MVGRLFDVITPIRTETRIRRRYEKKTGPEEAQYFHVRSPIGFI